MDVAMTTVGVSREARRRLTSPRNAEMVADELRDAEQTYPLRWIEEAIETAVANNVRKWRYIIVILERWRQEGKQDGIGRRDTQKELRQSVPDEYRDIIKR